MLRRFLQIVTDYAICIYLLLILVVLPFYQRQGYARIGSDKAYFFDRVIRDLGKVTIPLILLYMAVSAFCLRGRLWDRLRSRITVTDAFAAGYGLALAISWYCSDYRAESLWGADGWFMGLWPQLALVFTYLLVSKLWKPRKWMMYLALISSGGVFLLGCLNRAGLDPLGMSTDNPSFISTIGNINWYCGYLVSVFFAGVALLWQQEKGRSWRKLSLTAYVVVGFGSLLTQGSDSGLAALAVVILAMFALSVPDSQRMAMFWQEMLLLGGTCVAVYVVRGLVSVNAYGSGSVGAVLTTGWRPVFVTAASCIVLALVISGRNTGKYPERGLRILARGVVAASISAVLVLAAMIGLNTFQPGSLGPLSENPLFTFSLRWGSGRGATWQAGIRCFAEQDFLHKLVGVGPDAMSAYLYRAGSAELRALLEEAFGRQILTNAHNEWLTVLVNTGILGMAAFVGMILTGIRSFLGRGRNKITCACGFCLLAYTVNNLFSFQQSMNTSTLFSLFGIGGAFLAEERIKNGKEKLLETAGNRKNGGAK